MRIHYLQHVPFEDLAHIGNWARLNNHAVRGTQLFTGQPLPDIADFDFLVVMGGPMGVFDTREYDWMIPEKRLLEKVLVEKKPVLGICLGAQLIADVLGARVYKNKEKEIGWYPLTRVGPEEDSQLSDVLPERFFAFHWHGDTFDLPAGGQQFARSEACEQQAFFLPPRTMGLQFHLESTGESIDRLILNCKDEMVPGPFVQPESDIRSQTPRRFESSNRLMDSILDFMEARVSDFRQE